MQISLLCFLLLLFIRPLKSQYEKATRKSDTDMCPYVSKWKERAEDFCSDSYGFVHDARTRYHCLEKQSGGYVELCIKPMMVTKGHYPKWSSFYNPPRMYLMECPSGFYQSIKGWSNEIHKCRMKSKCSEKIGQLSSWCPDGGTVDDQQCRCDFKRGYISNLYALYNPLNKSCFTPSIENSACSMYKCEDDKELDRAYNCVNKCPENWYRPPRELECKRVLSPSVATTKNTRNNSTASKGVNIYATSTSRYPDPTRMNGDGGKEGSITATIVSSGVIVVVIIIIVIIAVVFVRRRQPTEALAVAYSRGSDNVEIEETGENVNESSPMIRGKRKEPANSTPPSNIINGSRLFHVHVNCEGKKTCC